MACVDRAMWRSNRGRKSSHISGIVGALPICPREAWRMVTELEPGLAGLKRICRYWISE